MMLRVFKIRIHRKRGSFYADDNIRPDSGSRSFRYSSIARMISFLTFSIVTSSRRWIPISWLTFLGCLGWPMTSKPSPQMTVTTPPRGTIRYAQLWWLFPEADLSC